VFGLPGEILFGTSQEPELILAIYEALEVGDYGGFMLNGSGSRAGFFLAFFEPFGGLGDQEGGGKGG